MANTMNLPLPSKANAKEDGKTLDHLLPDQHSVRHARSLSTSTVFSKRPSSNSSTGVRRRHSFRSNSNRLDDLPVVSTHQRSPSTSPTGERWELLPNPEGTHPGSDTSSSSYSNASTHEFLDSPLTTADRPAPRRVASDPNAVFKRSLEALAAGAQDVAQNHTETYTPGFRSHKALSAAVVRNSFSGYAGRFPESLIDPELLGHEGGFGATELRGAGARFVRILIKGTPEFIEVCSREWSAALQEQRLPPLITITHLVPVHDAPLKGPTPAEEDLRITPPALDQVSLADDEARDLRRQATFIPAHTIDDRNKFIVSNTQPKMDVSMASARKDTDVPANDHASDSGPSSIRQKPVMKATAFICPTHNQSFQKRTDLDRHYRSKRLHPESACEYKCPACPKKFSANVDNLARHLESQHNWDKDRRHALISRIRPKGRGTP